MNRFFAFMGIFVLACSQLSHAGSLLAQLDEEIEAGEYKNITSMLVARDGNIQLEGYWEADGSTFHDTRSATKTLVALAIGKLIAEGRITNPGVSAFDLFKNERPYRFESSVKEAISIRDLLTMSSALDCNDNDWESPGNEGHMYPAKKWLYFVLDLPTEYGYSRNEHGYGRFSYCTAGSFLLGQIVERAAEEPFDSYFRKAFGAPLGIDEVRWVRSPSGEVQTGGGAKMRSRDLLKLGELIRNRGSYGEVQVLPPDWIDEMTSPHVAPNAEQTYGYQIWGREFKCGKSTRTGWYMSGNGGNKVVVFPDLKLTVVVTATLYGTPGMHEQSTRLVEQYGLGSQAECSGI